MRWPSAHCATSSGIAMRRRRVNTQPDCPSAARTRLQSSLSEGASGFVPSGDDASGRSGLERCSQLSGGGGGLGAGGGGIPGSFLECFFAATDCFLGGGRTSGARGKSVRGLVMWVSTDRKSTRLNSSHLVI